MQIPINLPPQSPAEVPDSLLPASREPVVLPLPAKHSTPAPHVCLGSHASLGCRFELSSVCPRDLGDTVCHWPSPIHLPLPGQLSSSYGLLLAARAGCCSGLATAYTPWREYGSVGYLPPCSQPKEADPRLTHTWLVT